MAIFTKKMAKRGSSLRCRNWCFTSFNLGNYEKWQKLDTEKNKIKYIIYQEEVGKENHKHLQGYIEVINPVGMKFMKTLLGDDKIHLETRKGTAVEASNYCMKTEGSTKKPIILGKISDGQGKRNDLENMYDMIKKGASESEVCEENPGTYARYFKAYDRMTMLRDKKRLNQFHEVKVHVLWGKTGVGKTSEVFRRHKPEDVYRLRKHDGSTLWWDFYENQKVLLIDEFYGGIKYSELLQLLDGYYLSIQVKGGFRVSNWDIVYITSNMKPKNWYKTVKDTSAMFRRITSVQELVNSPTEGSDKTVGWNNCSSILTNSEEKKHDVLDNYLINYNLPGTRVGGNTVHPLCASQNTKNEKLEKIINNCNIELDELFPEECPLPPKHDEKLR